MIALIRGSQCLSIQISQKIKVWQTDNRPWWAVTFCFLNKCKSIRFLIQEQTKQLPKERTGFLTPQSVLKPGRTESTSTQVAPGGAKMEYLDYQQGGSTEAKLVWTPVESGRVLITCFPWISSSDCFCLGGAGGGWQSKTAEIKLQQLGIAK